MLFSAHSVQGQTISNVNPSTGMEGTTLSVAISGQATNFMQGTTTVWFNQGSSTIYANSVSVSNTNSLVAQVGIPYGTPLGLYQTNVHDPIDNTISLANSFTVLANPNSPAIVNVNPNSTMEGTSLTVSISGQNSNFQQGTTTVWFNQGSSTIYASNVTVNSNTNLDALFNIPFGTPLGLYGTNVQDPLDNTISLSNSFTITSNPNAPELVSVNPNSGNLGATIPVTISGQNTNFMQGTGTLIFVQGSSTLYTSNLLYNSNTEIGATLTIPSNAYPGYYDVYYTNLIDGTLLLVNGFYVNPPPCGNIDVNIVQQPCLGSPAGITVTGGFPPYSIIIGGQTIQMTSGFLDYYPQIVGDIAITSLVDNFGCPATSIDTLIHNDEFTATLNGASVCVGAEVNFISNIISSVPVSSVTYYYGDGFASSTSSHTYNQSGTFYPTLTVTNDNGCFLYVNASSPINVLPSPQDSIVSLTNATCGLINGAFEVVGVGPGSFSYNVTGTGGYTSNSAVNTGLSAGTYSITITDGNNCSSNNLISIANVSVLTNITGNVQTSTGNDANNTVLKLFSLADTIGAMAVSYTAITDANGNYSFANLAEGAYILSAEPDTNLFPGEIVTYSNGAALWYQADTIQVTCTSQQVIDFTLLNITQQTGTSQIGGFVAEYTFNMLPNVGVILYDENASQVVARTSTDAGGNYYFYGINPGQYSILLDFPGLNHISQHTFTLSTTDYIWDKGYLVDFGNRSIEAFFYIVGQNETVDLQSKVFPNPFNEQTTLTYNLPHATFVSIQVYNYLGELVETLVNESKQAGNHVSVFNTSNKSKGVYFIKINTTDTQKSMKVISVD